MFCFLLQLTNYLRPFSLFFVSKRKLAARNILMINTFKPIRRHIAGIGFRQQKNNAFFDPRQSLLANNQRERTNQKSFVGDFNTFWGRILTFEITSLPYLILIVPYAAMPSLPPLFYLPDERQTAVLSPQPCQRLSTSSKTCLSSSQALTLSPDTVSRTSYHLPVSTLPGRLLTTVLLSPTMRSMVC